MKFYLPFFEIFRILKYLLYNQSSVNWRIRIHRSDNKPEEREEKKILKNEGLSLSILELRCYTSCNVGALCHKMNCTNSFTVEPNVLCKALCHNHLESHIVK